ncbi:MAG: DNA double-strand break repair nuclease NurA [Pyrobaculum sp.]
MDYFFDEFIKTADKKLREYLLEYSNKSYPLDYLADRLLSRRFEIRDPGLRVGAVDGGIGLVKLSNGHEVILARAAAVGFDFIEKEFLVEVATVDSSSLPWAYLITVESLAGIKAIEKHGVDVLLIDGSLYAKVMRLVHNLILAREFQNLYYIPEHAAALYMLAKLLRVAEERGARLIFVSKDYSFRILKEHLVFEKLYERRRDYLFQSGLQWYSVLWIREFRKRIVDLYREIRSVDYESALLLALLVTQSITDAELLKRLLPSGHYTVPMAVGACDAYINYKKLSTVDKLVRAAESRFEDTLIFRLRDSFNLNFSALVREALENIPKVYMSYVRLGEEAPLLAEVPAVGSKMFDGTSVKAFSVSKDLGEEAGLLAAQYKNSVHYNVWLWYAHEIARFKSGQLAEYAVYIKKMAEGVGLARRLRLQWGV